MNHGLPRCSALLLLITLVSAAHGESRGQKKPSPGRKAKAARKLTADERLLFEAVTSQDLKGVKHLLGKGVSVNVRDPYGETPLFDAVEMDDLALVRLLLRRGADVNARARSGDTPLLRAAAASRSPAAKKIISLLIKKGARPRARNRKGETALIAAAKGLDGDTVRLLLQSRAVGRDRASLSRALLEALAQRESEVTDPCMPDRGSTTGGHNNNPAVVKTAGILLRRRPDVNLRDKLGRTALMWAAHWGHDTIVSLLLKSGARPRLRDKKGHQAVDLIRWACDAATLERLNRLLGGPSESPVYRAPRRGRPKGRLRHKPGRTR